MTLREAPILAIAAAATVFGLLLLLYAKVGYGHSGRLSFFASATLSLSLILLFRNAPTLLAAFFIPLRPLAVPLVALGGLGVAGLGVIVAIGA